MGSSMRVALKSVMASVIAGLVVSAGAASAQVTGSPVSTQPAPTRAAYTVEPFAPAMPITIQGTGVRLRAEPFTGNDTPVLSTGSTGLQLNVVGLARLPDWVWYQVVLRNGQKAFIRSDLTSAPMQGGTVARVTTPSPAIAAPQPRPTLPPQAGAITMTPQPNPAYVPPASQPASPQGAPSVALPLPSNPAPAANNGLISVAPSAPVPRMAQVSSLGESVMAQLVDKRCWTDSSTMMDAHRLRATFSMTFNTEGKLAAEPVLIQPALAPTDDPAMTVFIAKARAALRTCNGLGFSLPAEYFQGGVRPEVRVDFSAR